MPVFFLPKARSYIKGGMKLLLKVLALLLYTNYYSYAQDPSFSQFYMNRVYLNPALTGSESGLNMVAIYKNQWRAIPGAFHSTGVAMDMQMPRFSSGFGLSLLSDQVSKGLYKAMSLGFSYAYIVKINRNATIHAGLSVNYQTKAIDASKLIFSDQINPFTGFTGDPSSIVIANEKIGMFDMSVGILSRFSIPMGRNRMHNSIGFAVHHITSPDESFLNLETRLPRRYTVHYGSMIPVKKNIAKGRSSFYLSPVVKFDFQDPVKIFTAGVLTMFKPLYTGIMFQDNKFNNLDSRTLIFTGGIDAEIASGVDFTFGYSYDLNLTGISSVAQGVHEIVLKMRFRDLPFLNEKLKSGKKDAKCYEFGGKNAVKLF